MLTKVFRARRVRLDKDNEVLSYVSTNMRRTSWGLSGMQVVMPDIRTRKPSRLRLRDNLTGLGVRRSATVRERPR